MTPRIHTLVLSFLLLASPASLVLASTFPRFPRFSNTSCASASTSDFAWTALGLYYHSSIVFSTPAHQIDGGFVSFNLSNPAASSVVPCEQSSVQLHDFFYGDQWFGCADTYPPLNETAKTRSWFRFNSVTGRVDVNQTWTCGSGYSPVNFAATGTAAEQLSCNRTTWQNQNWTMGELYSTETVECMPIDLSIEVDTLEESG